jgi:hypothetical protein
MTVAFSAVIGGAYAEAVERRSGEGRGTAIRSNRLAVWREGGGRRVAVHTEHLSDDEADAVLRVENFTQSATTSFYLYLRERLKRRI